MRIWYPNIRYRSCLVAEWKTGALTFSERPDFLDFCAWKWKKP